MAFGNDGNLLQHSVKTALELSGEHCELGLYLVCTHAMAPFEPLSTRRAGCVRFDRWWQRARTQLAIHQDDPPVLTAYRRRTQLGRPKCPWLFTMDPFKYWPGDDIDFGDLHPKDLDRLAVPLTSFFMTGHRGVFSAFCYGMTGRTDHRELFREWARDLAGKIGVGGLEVGFVEVEELGHISALVSTDGMLLGKLNAHWAGIRDSF